MRIAFVVLALALSGCAGNEAVRDWRQAARANCEKEPDPIQRQTCRERVEAVTTTQVHQDDKKR